MDKKKVRSIIVEDELYDRQLIGKILTSNYNDYVEVVDSVDSVEKAIISIRENNPDLLFLDIELNGDRNGAFKILEQFDKHYKIIFVTAKNHQDDLLKAIRLSCIDYLIKPTKISDFEIPVKKAYEELNSHEVYSHKMDIFKHNLKINNIQEAKISLQEGFSYKPVYIREIVRCEAHGNYTVFFFTNKTPSLINGNLKSFEERLTDFGFCRINKSDLINLSQLKSFSRKNVSWEVTLTDNTTLYISPQRKQNFIFLYDSFHLC